jgi:hypothetical protein
MRNYFEWFIRHEKLIATITLVLVIALVLQMKYCKARVEPESEMLVLRPQAGPTSQPPPNGASGVSGKWLMTVEKKKGGTQTWTLTLEQSGEALKGVINSEGGDLPVTGTIKGKSINLSAKRYGVSVEFPATLDGDTMVGTMSVLTVTRQWRAKRE